MWSWILNNFVTLLIGIMGSCVAVRWVIPKYNPVMHRLQKNKHYGLFIQPCDYSETTLGEIRSVLSRFQCTFERVSEDFGNGISYLGVVGTPIGYGFEVIRDLLMWHPGLCVNVFVTNGGRKYDKLLFRNENEK